MKHIRIAIAALVLNVTSLAIFVPALASALAPNPILADLKGDAQNGLSQVGGGGASFTGTISAVVSVLSIIVGIAAVIMILVSAFKYITSGGESSKVSSAKTALIYALVGLAVAATAQALVHFVLSNAVKST